jgi:hypothetical protein
LLKILNEAHEFPIASPGFSTADIVIQRPQDGRNCGVSYAEAVGVIMGGSAWMLNFNGAEHMLLLSEQKNYSKQTPTHTYSDKESPHIVAS